MNKKYYFAKSNSKENFYKSNEIYKCESEDKLNKEYREL